MKIKEKFDLIAYTLHGRVQKLFDTFIPLKKKYTNYGYKTLRFKITGNIPAKKNDFMPGNNYRAIRNYAFATSDPKKYLDEHLKAYMIGSRKYLKWLEDIKAELQPQMDFWAEKYGIMYPLEFVSIHTCFWFADEYKRDLINMNESIYDMLVNKKIIDDDNYSVIQKNSSEGHFMKGEIFQNICVIDITVYFTNKN